MKYILPKDKAGVNALVSNALKFAKNTRVAIQQAAIGILYHAYKHGDYTGATDLVLGLKDTGIRRDSLVKFFSGFGGLLVNTDPKTAQEQPFVGWCGAAHIKENWELAQEKMWDTVVEEKNPFVDASLEAELFKVINRFKSLSKKAGEGKIKGHVKFEVSNGTLAAISALAGLPEIKTEANTTEVIDKLDQLLAGEVPTITEVVAQEQVG